MFRFNSSLKFGATLDGIVVQAHTKVNVLLEYPTKMLSVWV